MSLSWKNGCHVPSPRLFDVREDAQFVIHHDVMLFRVTANDIIQFKPFIDLY